MAAPLKPTMAWESTKEWSVVNIMRVEHVRFVKEVSYSYEVFCPGCGMHNIADELPRFCHYCGEPFFQDHFDNGPQTINCPHCGKRSNKDTYPNACAHCLVDYDFPLGRERKLKAREIQKAQNEMREKNNWEGVRNLQHMCSHTGLVTASYFESGLPFECEYCGYETG